MGDITALIHKSMEINRILRKQYTSAFCKNESIPCKPFGGSFLESIGPWPEIIYKGFRCPRSEVGLCSPCGYSNIEKVPNDRVIVNKSLLFQTKFIIEFFDELILKNQRRKQPYPAFDKRYPNGKDVMMVLTTTGSFFCDSELDEKTRGKILKIILSYIKNKEVNIQIFFESHCLDIIDFYEKGKFNGILPILKELNAVVIVGLESVDDFNRNVLYCKNLQMSDFEKAVDIIKNKLGLIAGAFVFVGFHSMNEYETIADVRRTISYLLNDMETMPVIMISNLKPYTMNHLLYVHDMYNLPDPRTVLSIAKTLKVFTSGMLKTENWLFADPGGGPPEPAIHPFNNPRKVTCDKCSQLIRKAIWGDYDVNEPNGLRETYNWEDFEEKIQPIDNCDCKITYEEYINKLRNDEAPLIERATQSIDTAKNGIEVYCNEQEKLLRR